MAQSIYKLFDYQAPENIRAAYLDNILVSPDRMAGMDLYSQLAATGTNVGGLLGSTLGRMAGYVPAGEAKAQAIDQIMSEAAKGSSPLAQATRAYELFSANGMGREARIAMERVEELTKETSKEKAKDALASALGTLDPSNPNDQLKLATLAAQAEQGSLAGSAFTTAGELKKAQAASIKRTQKDINQTRAVKSIDKEVSDDLAEVIGSDDAAFGKFLDATYLAKKEGNKTEFRTVGDRIKAFTYTPSSGNVVREQDIGPAAKPANTTIMLPPGETAYQKGGGEWLVKRDTSLIDAAEKAVKQLPKLYQVTALLEKGKATTGFGAEFINDMNRVKQQFMKDERTAESISDTELLQSLTGSDVFPMIDALGIGARGLDTPAERDFLQKVFTGTIEMSDATLKEMTRIREKYATQAIEEYNSKVETGYFKDLQKVRPGLKIEKLTIPKRPATGTNATVTNWN